MTTRDDARQLSAQHLADVLPRRWQHVQAVAARADEVASLPDVDPEELVAAAWLHDIGYAPHLARTGFHPLDGARYLSRLGDILPRVCALVAHHSCAVIEAEERGLRRELLHEFAYERSATADALWYADMTTGPDGQRFHVVDRLDEIRGRYGPDHLVTRFIDRAQTEIVGAVERTEARITRSATSPGTLGHG